MARRWRNAASSRVLEASRAELAHSALTLDLHPVANEDHAALLVGNAVMYSSGGGTNIGGLEDGKTYFLSFDPVDRTKLRLHVSAADALAPYLATSPGLSADAYSEWMARVCEQPADD